ncbi:unnamed protein product, partial [Ectocarpus sp. 12 AP-2014]
MTRIATAAALLGALPLLATPDSALAGESWDYIRAELYEGRVLNDGAQVIAIDAPMRTDNDARTLIAAEIAAPPGLTLGEVTLVLDENPMPVSAVFAMDSPQERFFFDVTMRVNGPTPLHVVAETTDGQLWVAETFVKTSGQGACAAPPVGDPDLALATLGQTRLAIDELTDTLARVSARSRKLDVDISHPSHSGMQMDQISLLYIPMRYVEDVQVDLDGAGYVG